MTVVAGLLLFLRALFLTRAALAAENLALRQQLALLRQSVKRPKLRPRDRVFWVWLSRLWRNWRSVLVIVQPDTVVRWHRRGLRLYWDWKSRRGRTGRPNVDAEIRKLIRRKCRENYARAFGKQRNPEPFSTTIDVRGLAIQLTTPSIHGSDQPGWCFR